MVIRLIAVGKLREPYLVAAAEDFRRRLRPYHRLEEIEVRAADGSDAARAMDAEGIGILRHLDPTDVVWLLDRAGTALESVAFAERLERYPIEGVSRISFVVAGTYGAAAAVHQRANVTWSLSTLTLLHEWARVFVLEQLYRAAKIAANEPYHH